MTLVPGLEAAFGYTVIEVDTAAALGSGQVSVLTTPQVLALAELVAQARPLVSQARPASIREP